MPTMQEFFCSPKFTSAIGDFLSTNTSELEFKPIDEEQPLKVWGYHIVHNGVSVPTEAMPALAMRLL